MLSVATPLGHNSAIFRRYRRGSVCALGPSAKGRSSLAWTKSSLSLAQDSRVEVASRPDGGVGVCDSKDPSGPVLRLTRTKGAHFLAMHGTGN